MSNKLSIIYYHHEQSFPENSRKKVEVSCCLKPFWTLQKIFVLAYGFSTVEKWCFFLIVVTSFWTSWGPWSKCNATCGVAFRNRTRVCKSSGQPSCKGKAKDRERCTVPPCPSKWLLFQSAPGSVRHTFKSSDIDFFKISINDDIKKRGLEQRPAGYHLV